MAVDKEKGNFITEDELEQEIAAGRMQQVDRTVNPNVPGLPVGGPPPAHGVDTYGSGPLPLNFGYQPALVKTGYSANTGPIGLLPIYQSPLVGSAIKSHTQPIAATANAANETANSAQTTATNANANATTAVTGVATVNAKTAVGIVSGVLQQVPISTLGTSTATPNQDNLNDGSTFGRVLNTALPSNQNDSTKPGFLAQGGSTVPQIVGTVPAIFSYTSTTTTVNISWSSFTIFFANNTTGTISSGSQSITGLSASSTYYFYPYLDPTNTVQFAAVTGGLGSPAILYKPQSPTAAQVINLQQNTALSNGGVPAITPTSGGGGGSGGGSGICLQAGQFVESQCRGVIPIETLEIGESILGRTKWTEVIAKKVVPQNHFVRVTVSTGERISLTPTHCPTAIRNGEEMSIPAGELSLSDFLILRDAYGGIKSLEHIEEESFKVQISCDPEHEFFASESKSVSILVHNVQPVS